MGSSTQTSLRPPVPVAHNQELYHSCNGPWAYQQTASEQVPRPVGRDKKNTDQLPAATAMAGVDMKLSPHAYRELHWHTANEWSLMLKGSVRLSAVDENGQTFNDDITAGDVWFFPAGVPHSIQALDEGCEFLLVFDDGSFSEDGTFLASELFMRNPKSVLSKNFQAPVSALENILNQ